MGVFSNLFGQKHQENWQFYFSKVDDKHSSIFVDLGLFEIAPIKGKTNVMWVSVKMLNPDQDGLSSEEEFDDLIEIEEKLIEIINEKSGAVYAGRLTSDGYRDFYFYIKQSSQTDPSVIKAMSFFPNYEYDFGTREDSEWKGYFDFLYPNPQEFETISNMKVLENLEKYGDDLSKPREVTHWLFFKNSESRNNYLKEVELKGFNLVSEYEHKDKDYSFSLVISRVDYVDWDSINESVLYLSELARKFDAEYDGWETSIENDD